MVEKSEAKVQDLKSHDHLSGPAASVTEIVRRLIVVVEDETRHLRDNDTSDIATYTAKKNRTLLELSRALASVEKNTGSSSFIDAVEVLRDRMTENKNEIRRHLLAVKEFSSFLETEARRNETDGTYSMSAVQFGD